MVTNIYNIATTLAVAVNPRTALGESPRWHAQEARLYWVDIAANLLCRWHPATGAVDARQFASSIACFGFRRDGGLILGMQDGCALVDDWDDEPRSFGEQVLLRKPHHRMNDGRVDNRGRFWVGSVNTAKDITDAALYSVDPLGCVTMVKGGMTTCNGAAFSADGMRFAHADTPTHLVCVHNVDRATGGIDAGVPLHQFSPGVGPGLGRPDGGSFDIDGCYWTALFDGWRVVQLSPDGNVLNEVVLPVQRPTMIAFGGKDCRTAFVTTARVGLTDQALALQPLAGAIFAFHVDVPGVPEWTFAG